jgi:hypothetical protein
MVVFSFFFFFLISLSSVSPLDFYESSSIDTFHGISTHDRHLYLNSTTSSIPCGYMIPTELDIFRYSHLRLPTGTISTLTEEEFNPDKCTIIIVRLLFGAYELFGPEARNYTRVPPSHYETICYLLITDNLSVQHPVILQSILNRTSTPWHVFVMKKLIYPNPAKTMKAIKLSLFRLFPLAKFILYYDLKYELTGNPLRFLASCNYYMKQANVSYAIYMVGVRQTIEKEFIGAQKRLKLQHTQGVVRNISEELSDIARQHQQYRAEGFFIEIKQRKPLLVDSAIIIFKRNESTLHRLFCAWMNEVILYSRRDQLSYPYVEHRLNITGFKIPRTTIWSFFKKLPHGYVAAPQNRR